MKSSQVEELNQKIATLLGEYGVDANYLVTYLVIDEDDNSIAAPTIANVSAVPSHGVSQARGAGFIAEILADTLVTLLCSYCGLDIMGAAGALKGMIEEARGTQMMKQQMEQARQNIPDA